jgi:excisionase family DNA binding protein
MGLRGRTPQRLKFFMKLSGHLFYIGFDFVRLVRQRLAPLNFFNKENSHMLTPSQMDQLADQLTVKIVHQINEQPGTDERLIDKKEAAKLLSCSVPTIERLVRENKIPSIKIGGLRRFSKSELLNFCQNQTGRNQNE